MTAALDVRTSGERRQKNKENAMTDYSLDAEPGRYSLTGDSLELKVIRGAETWQFFAFVFAAVVTLALTLIDEIPNRQQGCRIAAKVVVFVGIGYLTLWNVQVRNWLVALLGAFKEEHR